jgi:hypothetical protein
LQEEELELHGKSSWRNRIVLLIGREELLQRRPGKVQFKDKGDRRKPEQAKAWVERGRVPSWGQWMRAGLASFLIGKWGLR